LLLSIQVCGRFEYAELYQLYRKRKSVKKIVYETVRGCGPNAENAVTVIINPFPESGIPLLQVHNTFKLDVIGSSGLTVAAGIYTLLRQEDRAKIIMPEVGSVGAIVKHKSGDVYVVTGVDAIGTLKNALVPLDSAP
jgi:hypothetical protein